MGLEGYAIYFMLLEVLREQLDFKYPLSDLDLLADEFGTSEAKVNVIVNNYDLFILDDEHNFFSIKQIYYLQPYIEKTERARNAAQKRWNLVNKDTNAMQMHSKCNANAMQIKESKVKEIKEKEINIDFEWFWNNYDKKVGVKEKLKKKWNNLTDEERQNAMNYIDLYKQSVPDKQFRKNPETFLKIGRAHV